MNWTCKTRVALSVFGTLRWLNIILLCITGVIIKTESYLVLSFIESFTTYKLDRKTLYIAYLCALRIYVMVQRNEYFFFAGFGAIHVNELSRSIKD